MDDLLERLRTQVERATDPIDPSEISRTMRRRRRRSRTLNIVAVATLAAVAVAVVALQSPQSEERTSSAPTPGPSNLGLALERIVAPEDPDGTRLVLIEFDGKLPDGAARYVEDITSVDAPAGLTYTTQDMTDTVWVCADRHFGFGPGAVGQQTIDVLIPAEWLEIGKAAFPDRFSPFAPAADGVSGDWAGKILGCGPYKGYVQFSITSVAGLADPADVRVETDGDSIRVVIPANDCLSVHEEVLGDLSIASGAAVGPRSETPIGSPVFFIATSDGALWLTNRDPSAGRGLALPLNDEARAASEVGVDVPSDAPAYGGITAGSDGAAEALGCAGA